MTKEKFCERFIAEVFRHVAPEDHDRVRGWVTDAAISWWMEGLDDTPENRAREEMSLWGA
jgi:hypothetical protein